MDYGTEAVTEGAKIMNVCPSCKRGEVKCNGTQAVTNFASSREIKPDQPVITNCRCGFRVG